MFTTVPDEDLVHSAAEAVEGGEDIGVDLREVLIAVGRVVAHGHNVRRGATALLGEFARIVNGQSTIERPARDSRFTDVAWVQHPLYRRVGQAYLATCAALDRLIDEARLDWRSEERARFAVEILTSLAAPTNTLLGNPAALKRAFETGGITLTRGARNYLHDLRHNGGMPSQVDKSKFTVGTNVAATPGAVVYRDEICEVIQYAPTTGQVRQRPVLCVPPQINKHYIADMSPGRSLAEYVVGRGIPFFIVSWRNPGRQQHNWALDDYASSLLHAIDVVLDIAGSDDLDLLGLCAGGITASAVVNHLASMGDERVASLSYAVTLLDLAAPTMVGLFSSARLMGLARRRSRHKGIIDARSLGAMFLWVRPNDLIWNFWVNNYLMGNDPPAFDILFWNQDGTNLPAALHAQFLEIFVRNLLVQPGGVTVLGTPVDLRQIKCPTYVVGGTSDHLTQWKATFRTTQLVGGESTFVLSNTGHVQTVVCPPTNPKAHYFAGPEPDGDPEAWLAAATRQDGSWWSHWTDWLLVRSAAQRKAPTKLGSRNHPALEPAPGRYVRLP